MDEKLKKFTKYLSNYKAVHVENGIEVAWGHDLIGHMDDTLWNELKQINKPIGVNVGMRVEYYIITKELTHGELVTLLGPYTKEVRGPSGGFKYIQFGKKSFYSKWLASPIQDKRTIRLKRAA